MNESQGAAPYHYDVRCHHCHKINDVMKVEIQWKKLENTLTQLPEIGRPTWKCEHCGCWQDEDA